jgi:hypothetical protein
MIEKVSQSRDFLADFVAPYSGIVKAHCLLSRLYFFIGVCQGRQSEIPAGEGTKVEDFRLRSHRL